MRFWVLVKENGKKRIYELKAWAPSGVSEYQSQRSPEDWFRDINGVLRAGFDPSGYSLVKVGNEGFFWLREKKVNLIDLDYNGKNPSEKQFAMDLALYDAWYLGQLHGSQPDSRKYLEKIKADQVGFKNAVKKLAKKYLLQAVTALEKEK